MIHIELKVEKVSDFLDLEELKQRVIKNVRENEDDWINYGDVEDIVRSIESSYSHKVLIDRIGRYIHPSSE